MSNRFMTCKLLLARVSIIISIYLESCFWPPDRSFFSSTHLWSPPKEIPRPLAAKCDGVSQLVASCVCQLFSTGHLVYSRFIRAPLLKITLMRAVQATAVCLGAAIPKHWVERRRKALQTRGKPKSQVILHDCDPFMHSVSWSFGDVKTFVTVCTTMQDPKEDTKTNSGEVEEKQT